MTDRVIRLFAEPVSMSFPPNPSSGQNPYPAVVSDMPMTTHERLEAVRQVLLDIRFVAENTPYSCQSVRVEDMRKIDVALQHIDAIDAAHEEAIRTHGPEA